MVRQRSPTFPLDDAPLWYKDAIIYELHVRAFHDSDGDGIGDFPGLTEKLDYLQDLGVTALWLLPFYPSPLRDDGYDIADYTQVHPAYGTLHDFNVFLLEAHRRGLRVITELVLNHTSDQHPWFQRARRARPGSRWRDFYVWSDSPGRYKEARIIFKDFESSNWSRDPVAGAYYWHRFYSHQPDLNYDHPQVRRAMLRVVDFWLRLGVDGLRLDAVPYLYEREGTNCENLPETHAFLKELRRHVDENFKDRMLLAEANQWPEDAMAYFGDGDESHVAFHFPIMPRLFMATRMENYFPIVDILQQTPPIPETCQWALFLRNHDELTLEMVTDEERDYMYRAYAHDPEMRINLGIRRRLAPLLGNDRRLIELMNALLLSLPGTPVVYYGDEIGVGDNVYLGDRNSVRTPMQWSDDRNAGFSHANPQKLYLPVCIDSPYHYEAVNVEAQEGNPLSLLRWMKRQISLRRRFRAFGRGSLEFLYPANHKVLAFIRSYREERILVVANLSRFAQSVELDLAPFKGMAPVELFGRAAFPAVRDELYHLSLGPYGFYWFSLEPQRVELPSLHTSPADILASPLQVRGGWEDLLGREGRVPMGGVLLRYLRGCRWFGGKGRVIRSAEIRDSLPIRLRSGVAYLVLVRVEYTAGEGETYLVPLAFASGDQAAQISKSFPHAIVACLRVMNREGVQDGVLYDALVHGDFCRGILESIAQHRRFRSGDSEVTFWPGQALHRVRGSERDALDPSPLRAEQSNTSVRYGDRVILKLFRRVAEGPNPDLEIGGFLTDKAQFPHVPPVVGAIEYRPSRRAEAMTLGVLQGYVRNQGDAWGHTLEAIGRYLERVMTHPEVQAPPVPEGDLLALCEQELPGVAVETVGPYLVSVELLGRRTAQLHQALASSPADPDFAPEPFSLLYQRSLYQAMRSLTLQNWQLLRERVRDLPEAVREEAERVLGMEGAVIARFHSLRRRRIDAMRIRIHGDYHLGQVLYTGNDFVIIDFEGEPARPLSERRIKRSPLRDVAGMIRSFHYASHAVLSGQGPIDIRPQDLPVVEYWAQLWYLWISTTFLRSYLEQSAETGLLPQDQEGLRLLLDAYLLEKGVYELGYELNNRPQWVGVPLRGILQLLEAQV